MKRLIMISTALFAAASTFGIVYFVKIAHQPAIQNLYSHTPQAIEEVPEDIPEYFVNQQGEIDSLPQKKEVINSKQIEENHPKKVTAKKKKSSTYIDSKAFSRAAIPVPIEPVEPVAPVEPAAPIAPVEEAVNEKD